MTLPGFLGLGAQKAGTSWLHAQLSAHPQIYVPTIRKEVHYFDRFYDKGQEWYSKYFPSAEQAEKYTAIGEITPRYLALPDVPLKIKETLGAPKMLVILRDPVDRFYSQYRMAFAGGGTSGTPLEYLQQEPMSFDRGLYYDQLNNYLEVFPRENFLILIYEEIFQDNESIIRALGQVAEFLDVSPDGFDLSTVSNVVSKTGVRPKNVQILMKANAVKSWLRQRDFEFLIKIAKKAGLKDFLSRGSVKAQEMTDLEREELMDRYQDDVTQLEVLLGRSLTKWGASRNPS